MAEGVCAQVSMCSRAGICITPKNFPPLLTYLSKFSLFYSCLVSFWKCRTELCCLSFFLSFTSSPAESLALFVPTSIPFALGLIFCHWNNSKQKWDLFPNPKKAGNSGLRKALVWLVKGTWNLELLVFGPFCTWEPHRVWFGSIPLRPWRLLKKTACGMKLIISQVTVWHRQVKCSTKMIFPPDYFSCFALRYEGWGCL